MADEKDKKVEGDDVLGFDPSLKKKKKKKKVRIEGEGGEDEVDLIAEAVAEVTVREAVKEAEEAEGEDDMDLSKKKKKKKKSTEGEAAAPPAEPEADEEDLSKKKKKKSKDSKTAEESTDPAPAKESDEEADLLKKKKKKSTSAHATTPAAKDCGGSDDDDDDDDGDDIEIEDLADDGGIVFGDNSSGDVLEGHVATSKISKGALPWAGSDRDYTYQELLTRVMETLREKNPELSGEKKRFVMKPPQVVKEGSKKTLFINFKDICKILKRNHEHVYQFILAELGTSGSIDGAERMIIKGRFQPKAIENIIRHYVVEYVTCHSCKSPDTLLQKDNRLFFLVCNQCGAQRSVASIKTGYVAQVGKRKKV